MASSSIYDTTDLTTDEAKVLVNRFLKEVAPQSENLDIARVEKVLDSILDDIIMPLL